MTEAREPRLVLDTSAVAAWLRGSIAVDETLAEADDEAGAALTADRGLTAHLFVHTGSW